MKIKDFASIGDSKEFSYVYRNAKKWHCSSAIVYFLESEEKKFAAVASKKVGKAVDRNLAKRRIRCAFAQLNVGLKSGIYIIISKSNIAEQRFSEIKSNLIWSFKKLDCLK